jgi:hypothetical protein
MQSFVAEGRITPISMITADITSGFFRAEKFEYFHYWNKQSQKIAVGAEQHISMPLNAPHKGRTQQAPKPHPLELEEPYNPLAMDTAIIEPVMLTGTDNLTGMDNTENLPTNIYMVMAEIKSDRAMSFLQTMQKFGTPQRVSDTVWLLRSTKTANEMRNTLSQTLTNQDRLFILDSTNNKTAWFNIGSDLDHRIRELWDEDKD